MFRKVIIFNTFTRELKMIWIIPDIKLLTKIMTIKFLDKFTCVLLKAASNPLIRRLFCIFTKIKLKKLPIELFI